MKRYFWYHRATKRFCILALTELVYNISPLSFITSLVSTRATIVLTVHLNCSDSVNFDGLAWRAGKDLGFETLQRYTKLVLFKESMGARNRVGIGLSYQPARLHSLAEFIPWNRFLGSINVTLKKTGSEQLHIYSSFELIFLCAWLRSS
jgi:hypothetical protein